MVRFLWGFGKGCLHGEFTKGTDEMYPGKCTLHDRRARGTSLLAWLADVVTESVFTARQGHRIPSLT